MKIEINSRNRELKTFLTKKESELDKSEVDGEVVSLLVSGLAAKIYEVSENKAQRKKMYESTTTMLAITLARMDEEYEGE